MRSKIFSKRSILYIVLFLQLLQATNLCAFAQGLDPAGDAKSPPVPQAGLREIEELDRQIILSEIQLEKHSINFRRYNNVQGRWKGWRYFISQEANNVSTAAGLLYGLAERARIVKHPYVLDAVVDKKKWKIVARENHPKRSKIEGSLYPQIAGQFIGAGGSMVELGINYFHEWQCRKRGYDCRTSVKTVKELKERIDTLFARREALIASSSLGRVDSAIARAEGTVLRDITNLSLEEYENFHVAAHRFKAFQDSIYLLDIAKNTVGAAGNIVQVAANHENRPYVTGHAGVLTTVSGALIIAAPALARGWGKLVGEHHRHRLRQEVYAGAPCQLTKYDLDRKGLQTVINDKVLRGEVVSEKAAALLDTYEGNAAQRAKQVQLAQSELRAGTRAAQENVLLGSIVGTSKVCLGVTTMVAGYRLTSRNHRANDVILPGNITYASALWVSAAENIRLRVLDEVRRKKLGAQRLLPSQVLADRLTKLEELETNLKAVK
ncbi:MAG: hypothetical protein JSS86_04110 [Cyanobacteria bacterium SZAS LIN-2]|nr:hypothetical protein [Cyanobacteria bacterium SZAS LIN-2]